ncbi:MAG: ATP synthase F0 subunit B [Bacteriovoracales bacterium]|nr:ATP synthase F0 subunit B [Bacteriovoracales bacterium]
MDSSVIDLAAPTVNFIIFSSILYWALKGPVKNHFASYEDHISRTYKKAQDKKKEAHERWVEYEEKIKNLPEEVSEILAQTEKNVAQIESQHQRETQKKVAKFQEDSKMRLKAHEASLVEELNRQLLESVVQKTKSSLHKDSSLRSKARQKLVKETLA